MTPRPMTTVANAKPTSIGLIEGAAARTGAIGAEGAFGAALGRAWAGIGATAGAAGTAAVVTATAGAPGAGILIAGPPVGLGGKLMRTVCFFCAASAALGGSAGVGGVPGFRGSAIGNVDKI